jgi:hypothetical protein
VLTGGLLHNRTLLLPLVLLASSAALAEPAPLVSLRGRAVPDVALRAGIERCQRDAPELPVAECIERYQVPLWQLSLAADQRFAASLPLRREIESSVLAERLTELWLEQGAPTEQEVASYLEEHRAAWKTPERLRLFRILVGSREQAVSLITELGRKTPADFRSAARSSSLDRASHERGGDLGFVAADGTTDVAGVSADPALFAAAHAVPDGAFVPEPVAEGAGFAVVWRRGSLPARKWSDAEARDWASARIREQKAGRQQAELLAAHPASRQADLLARFRRPECLLFTP